MKFLLVSAGIVGALACQPALAQIPGIPLGGAAPVQTTQCQDCGTVQGINQIQKEAESGGAVGMIGGGLVGGLLGHQIGGGTGRDIATVAGAVGGAYVGNQMEKKMSKKTIYQVIVKFDDGRTQVFEYDNPPGTQVGGRVRLVNGVLQTM